MLVGDMIAGYRLTTEFTTADGGQCQWALAMRGDTTYFLKRFLDPRFPVDDGPGSAETKRQRRFRCHAFEEHQRVIIAALSRRCAPGGNLVVARAFFREGTTYYKVTDYVDRIGLTPADVVTLPPREQCLFLATLTHSVALLHDAGIVHGDLRPENVLPAMSRGIEYVAKLIDLDSCYVTAAPPPAHLLAADPTYAAPEVAHYTSGGAIDACDLTIEADIFSLGLLIVLYTVGPDAFAALGSHAPHEFAQRGYPIPLAWEHVPPPLVELVRQMLAPRPERRPPARTVLTVLKYADHSEWASPCAPVLHGTLLSRCELESSTPSRLRGTLIGSR